MVLPCPLSLNPTCDPSSRPCRSASSRRSVATAGPGSRPSTSSSTANTIWISTEAARAKAIDVGRTGWASLCIVGPAAPYPSVTIEGPATIEATDVAPMTSRILARISGGEPPELTESELAAAGRVLLRLDVDRVYGASHLPEDESR